MFLALIAILQAFLAEHGKFNSLQGRALFLDANRDVVSPRSRSRFNSRDPTSTLSILNIFKNSQQALTLAIFVNMRTGDTRKWVDKMERAAKNNQRSSKKRKLSAVDNSPKADGEVSFKNIRPENLAPPPPPTPPPPQLINLSVIHSAGDLEPRDASPTFPYQSLDNSKLEIRVFTLKPGRRSSPIECSLRHVMTDKGSHPSYKALSYTWGSPENLRTILLDGIRVQVRENLWQALYHLRSEDKSMKLWVDAICINQDDIPERNNQVSRMGTLYGMANEVVVWLGPERDGSKHALEFIVKNMSSKAVILPLDLVSNLTSRPELEGIVNLTRREYWNRAWIIQEVFRARKVYIQCGFERLPWTHLAKFFRYIEKHAESDASGQIEDLTELRQSLAARFTKYRTAQNMDLEMLLRTYRSSLCVDPRDKIHSLLGLAGRRISASAKKKSRPQWIAVDYSKSAQELFECLALLYYEEGGVPGSISCPNDHRAIQTMSYGPEQSMIDDSRFYQVQRMQMLQGILRLEYSWQGTKHTE